MNKENVPPERPRPKIRHHNPGTKYVPVERQNLEPKVRLLSSIVVVPPRTKTVSCQTDTVKSQVHTCTCKISKQERKAPVHFQRQPLNQISQAGPSRAPVRDTKIPWKLNLIDVEPYKRPHFTQVGSIDPRRMDLRIHLKRLKLQRQQPNRSISPLPGPSNTRTPSPDITSVPRDMPCLDDFGQPIRGYQLRRHGGRWIRVPRPLDSSDSE